MNLKEIMSWETSDGRLFRNKDAAIQHEAFNDGARACLAAVIRLLHNWGEMGCGGEGRRDTQYHKIADQLTAGINIKDLSK